MNLSLGENLTSAKGGLSYSLTVAVYLAVSIVASMVIAALGIAETDAGRYIAYLVSPVAIAIAVAATLKVGKIKPRQAFPVGCKPKYYLIALLLIFGLMFSLSAVNGYLVELLKLLGYTPRTSTLPDLGGWGVVGGLIVIALLPAIFEEALFRGVMLNNVEAEAGTVRAVFLVGFAFSLYHGTVEQTVYQFICGCLFALLALRARSVLPSVVIHFINNAVIVVLYSLNAVDELGNIIMSPAAYVTITVLSAISLLAAIALLVFDKSQVKPKKREGVARFFVWAMPGIFIMALFWIFGLFGL